MGAVFSDGKCDNRERDYVRALVADLLCKSSLPPEVEILIDRFEPERFDLNIAAADFMSDPPMNKRRVMELVAYVTLADGAQTLQEDGYLRRLGEALGMHPEEFRHLTSDPDMAAMRESFTDLARIPLRQSRW
jgi:tellurite resistance protein